MNFGESLAYWYLRLNGFFPVTNFVLHRLSSEKNQNADCDILAVRFPYVRESINENQLKCDDKRFQKWGLNHQENIIGLIVEVKTSRECECSNFQKSFAPHRLEYLLQRLGFFFTPPKSGKDDTFSTVLKALEEGPIANASNYTIANLAVAPEHSAAIKHWNMEDTNPTLLHMTIEEMIGFVKSRMKQYKSAKSASRMFFPDDLIQLFAWQAGIELIEMDDEPGLFS